MALKTVFMQTHPLISEVCGRPGQIYQAIDKTEFIEFDIGTYMGKVVNKKRSGMGLMMFKDGMYYEGEWENDRFQGRGKFIFTTGDFYEGDWKGGLPEGSGLYVSRDPLWRYEGAWVNGVQQGKGKEVFADSSYYEGYFENGARHGKGKFQNHNGTFYEGDFQHGEIHGNCQACDFEYLYEGEWKSGRQDGTGKSQWFDQNKKLTQEYIGEYKNGLKNGFGEYRDKDGVAFKGKWANGLPTNNGVIIKNQKDNREQAQRSDSQQNLKTPKTVKDSIL